jgi:hypothetical protein
MAREAGCANMTLDEERTIFANWAIISSPLVLAIDTRNDTVVERYWSIVTSRRALQINSAWVGSAGTLLKQNTEGTNRSVPVGMSCEVNNLYRVLPNWLIYVKPLPGGLIACLTINLGESKLAPSSATVSIAELLETVTNVLGWSTTAPPPSVFSTADVWTGEAGVNVSAAHPWSAAGLSPHNSSFVVFTPVRAS